MPTHKDILSNIGLSAAGAFLGGIAFCLLFENRGIYAPMLVFGVTGIGGGLLLRRRYWQLGLVSVTIGCLVNLYVEVRCQPFSADPSAFYYLTHLHQLDPVHLGPIAIPGWLLWILGSVICFWFGMGRPRGPSGADE